MPADPVRRSLTRPEILGHLNRDRIWCAYALGDLEPGMFERCEWYASGSTLALLFHGLDYVPLFTTGDARGIAAILAGPVTRPGIYLNQRPEHFREVERFYRPRQVQPMWRMYLDNFHESPHSAAAPLGPEHAARLQELYRMGGGDAFAPFQLDAGFFRGIGGKEGLVAVAGVHLASPAYGVAAVGNVFTHPEHRGKGLAAACTSAVVRALLDAGISTIVLNVEQANLAAIRIYERMGFKRYCEFYEGFADRI